MNPTPTQHRIASLATQWAAEVAPRIRLIAPDPKGTALARFSHHLRGEDPTNQLTTTFYITLEESLAQSISWQPGATEVEEGAPLHLSQMIRRLVAETQVVASPFSVQRQAIPEDFVCLAEEVALCFMDCVEWFMPERGFLHGLLMERQLAALVLVDGWFRSLWGQSNATLWTDEALQTAPQWNHARELAKESLQLFAIDMP